MNDVQARQDASDVSVEVPRAFNAATAFIDRHLQAGRGEHVAVIDADGSYTYAELAERVNRAGNALLGLGMSAEQRVLMCMLDGIDFVAVFWGAIKAGLVPIPVNTLLTSSDYEFMLRDSRAQALVVSDALWPRFEAVVDDQPRLEHVLVAGAAPAGRDALGAHMAGTGAALQAAATSADDIAFWLYTSGSTGNPKGAMHLHRSLVYTAETYGRGVLGIEPHDVVFSAAKLFFAYGLGNAMTFPLHVGATAVLFAGRPTPDAVMQIMREHQPSVFYGVPTLYAALLAAADVGAGAGSRRLRRCVSAGEALPGPVAGAWRERVGVEIIDGIGTTELLHIFLSNRPGEVRDETSGKAVPGYRLRVVDEHGADCEAGEVGELLVQGGSAAQAYWNQRDRSLNTFQGPWTRTGDKYQVDADGYYQYCGRTDDMLKVGGIWVSPFEVESALLSHDAVLEAAVVGHADDADLIKPRAFVVLKDGQRGDDAMVAALQAHVKDRLAPYKYPRWVEFVDELPKTATGKIQRFKLRS